MSGDGDKKQASAKPPLHPTIAKHQASVSLTLSLCFFLSIGSYWLVRPIKMGVFINTVGLEHEPQAKFGTVLILVPLLFLYNKLVAVTHDARTVVNVVLCCYTLLFTGIAVTLSIPEYGMDNTVASADRWIGWIVYWTIETFGSIVMPMFWSVAATVVREESAAGTFPRINAAGQVGAVAGATLATYTKAIGFPQLFFVQVALLLAILLMSWRTFYISDDEKDEELVILAKKNDADPAPQDAHKHHLHHAHEMPKEKSTSLMEGLKLLVTRRYVASLFVISSFSEIVSTIMDYQMKVLAKAEYSSPADFALLMGRFGQAVNTISLIFALTGTKFAISRFGLRFCLLAFPLCTGALIVLIYLLPSLWIIFFGMVLIKALSYSLNAPSKEMLYLRTSKDIKYKAKSWIDMFGSRWAKGLGSLVTNVFRSNPEQLLHLGSLSSGLFVAVWLYAAEYLGNQYHALTQSGAIVS